MTDVLNFIGLAVAIVFPLCLIISFFSKKFGKNFWYVLLAITILGLLGTIIWLMVKYSWAVFNIGTVIGSISGLVFLIIAWVINKLGEGISVSHAWYTIGEKSHYFRDATVSEVWKHKGCSIIIRVIITISIIAILSYVVLWFWQSKWELLVGLTVGYLFWIIAVVTTWYLNTRTYW